MGQDCMPERVTGSTRETLKRLGEQSCDKGNGVTALATGHAFGCGHSTGKDNESNWAAGILVLGYVTISLAVVRCSQGKSAFNCHMSLLLDVPLMLQRLLFADVARQASRDRQFNNPVSACLALIGYFLLTKPRRNATSDDIQSINENI